MACMPGKRFFFVPVFGTICLVSLPCTSALPQAATSGQGPQPAMVLHVEAREAVLDVVARDRQNMPVADLTADEFRIYEVPDHGDKIPRRVLYLRTIDPQRKTQEEDSVSGFDVSSGAICALDSTVHYQVAIQASSEPGFHTILVETTRPHVQLSFRLRYFVGLTREKAATKDLKMLVTPTALSEAACYHPLTPPTLAITAKVLDAPGGSATRYAVVIKPESLSDIGLNSIAPRVQLDFGMCVFNAAGEAVDYMNTTVDRQLNSTDIARSQDHGFVSLLKFPGTEPPALVRLAVLDRNTGNLGIVDVSRPLSIAAQTSEAEKKPPLIGDIRAFGSVTPSENTFCGDVYELQGGAVSVSSFRELDPVGSLYTNTLNVPNQNITRMGGIPGITHTSVWFGIDYYGRFYVTVPGKYSFELESDDGSRLEIDDRRLIDLDGQHSVEEQTATTTLSAGWHSIHVPYFQGPPFSLALVLRIKPPGQSMRPFNLNEFVPPVTKP
jgi:PA14 domain